MSDSLTREAHDAAQWWQAYCLAENDEADELRQRADRGDDHARRQLAGWLGDRGRAQEAVAVIRPLADAGEDIAQLWLARWLAECGQAGELRERADAGDAHALDELQDGWPDITGSMSSASSSRPRRAVPVWSGQPAMTVSYP